MNNTVIEGGEALLALAARVEAASADDEELFRDVFRTVFPKPERVWVTDNNGRWTPEYAAWSNLQDIFYEFVEVGAFLDAAMTLVPEGAGGDLLHVIPERLFDGKGYATLADTLTGQQWRANAATPALALTAACLRARAQQDGREGA
jgi:hypothetical protein